VHECQQKCALKMPKNEIVNNLDIFC
jgi:hypothetical protein